MLGSIWLTEELNDSQDKDQHPFYGIFRERPEILAQKYTRPITPFSVRSTGLMNDSCAQLNSEQPKTIQNPDKNKTRNSLIPNHSNKLNVQNIQSLENKNRDETMKREVNNTSLHKIKNYVPRCSIATPPPVYVF